MNVKLFTPGPLSTSPTVKQTMLVDYGSRDDAFISCIADVRRGMLRVGGMNQAEWTTVPLQGSGTSGVEATVGTLSSRAAAKDTSFLVINSGKYAERMTYIVKHLGIPLVTFDVAEGKDINLKDFESFLKGFKGKLSFVGVVHSETSTGMMNDIIGIAKIVRRVLPSSTCICIDAMSSFGGVDVDYPKACDVLVTSSNKCIHGVPGFSLTLIRKSLLKECTSNPRSFTLDLVRQCNGLDSTGQFPFTPPVHAIIAFRQALLEHERGGGVQARSAQYRQNAKAIVDGMVSRGFKLFLDPNSPTFGSIIVAFMMPSDPWWNFTTFYSLLRKDDIVIYPGKVSTAETFRIGCIGEITMQDIRSLLVSVDKALLALNAVPKSKL